MATEAMLSQTAWLLKTTDLILQNASGDVQRFDWADLRYFWNQGYSPDQAARKYLEARHLGVNS